jgi:hypothetical protein
MHRLHPLTRIIRLALVLAACALAVRPGAAQSGVTATSGSPAAIGRIRAAYAAIEREAPGYRRTTHDVWNFSLEGGELHGFFRGRELRKLSARLYGEMWQGTDEFYFADGELIFIHTVQERYRGMFGEGGVQATIEHRYYFDGGRLIRRVRTQRPANAGEDMTVYDADLDGLLRHARLFAACAAAPAGDNRPECTAPDR